MKKILITGAHGFIGTNLSHYLSKDENLKLIALDLSKKINSPFYKEYTWKEIHNIDYNSINTIIHLAGLAHDTSKIQNSNRYFDINVGLTKQIFDQFIISSAKKFIYFSSVKAVADSVNKILTEEDSPNPQTPYGKSKLEAERYLLGQVLPKDKFLYILRPAMVHGPGNKGNLNLLFNLINKGLPYPLGAFTNQRSFTSVENLDFVIKQFIERDIEQGVYQIADKEPVSTNEIIELIGESILRKPKIWNIPAPLIRGFAKMGTFFSLPLNYEILKKLTENYRVSNQKLVKALGVELPVHAREGLKLTLNSFSPKSY